MIRCSCFSTVVLITVLAVVTGMQVVQASGASVQGFVPISGSGSTWSQNAVDQWRRNVNNLLGIVVNYAGNGSTAGRNDFRFGQVDFAVSEIPYGWTEGGVLEVPPDRAFGYVPFVAGGLSFHVQPEDRQYPSDEPAAVR